MPRENLKAAKLLAKLANALRTYTDVAPEENPYLTPIEDFAILRSNHKKLPSHRIFKPALCLTVQGAKWATFGERRLSYRAGEALLVTVDMPSSGTVSAASPTEPFLGIVIGFDVAILHEVAEQLHAAATWSNTTARPSGALVLDLSPELLDCALRAVRLLRTPAAIPILYPGIMRELCYWVLAGPSGEHVFRTLISTSPEEHLLAAIHTLRDRFTEPVRTDELAAIARMSPATFHRQFKSVTAMTPLQYQKQLRLLEARRLMLTAHANVETAAFQVGYESPSQFSREYTRMFGKPPRRDITTLISPAA